MAVALLHAELMHIQQAQHNQHLEVADNKEHENDPRQQPDIVMEQTTQGDVPAAARGLLNAGLLSSIQSVFSSALQVGHLHCSILSSLCTDSL